VHVGSDAAGVHAQMVEDWWAGRQRGEEVVMLAGRRSQVNALNRLARQCLRQAGHLGTEEVIAGGRAFALGDDVIAGRNDYRLGLLNGTRATVTAVDPRRTRVRWRQPMGPASMSRAATCRPAG
jgi:ATP-dependent exoDNAse (exonuclease V) alpha subunit